MIPSKKIWVDGKFLPWKSARIHILTHTLHYGYGVFEGIRAYETKKGTAIFRLDDHIDRLFFSAKTAGIKIPYSKKQIIEATKNLVRVNNVKSCYIRPLVYCDGDMGLGAKVKPHLSISLWKWGAYLNPKGISLYISSYRRPSNDIQPVNAKVCGNYVTSILAKREAMRNGFDEAVMLDISGKIAECTGENIFAVKSNKLITPPLDHILKGITRDSIIKIAKDLGYKTIVKFFKPQALLNADEVFICGTAAEITPVVRINKKIIGKPGPITRELQQKYSDIVHGRNKRYEKWLCYIN